MSSCEYAVKAGNLVARAGKWQAWVRVASSAG